VHPIQQRLTSQWSRHCCSDVHGNRVCYKDCDHYMPPTCGAIVVHTVRRYDLRAVCRS